MNSLQIFETISIQDQTIITIKQRGFIVGRFAIYRVYMDNYRIAHLPTGCYLLDCKCFRQAVVLAALLNELPDVTPFMRLEDGLMVRGDIQHYDETVALWKNRIAEYRFEDEQS